MSFLLKQQIDISLPPHQTPDGRANPADTGCTASIPSENCPRSEHRLRWVQDSVPLHCNMDRPAAPAPAPVTSLRRSSTDQIRSDLAVEGTDSTENIDSIIEIFDKINDCAESISKVNESIGKAIDIVESKIEKLKQARTEQRLGQPTWTGLDTDNAQGSHGQSSHAQDRFYQSQNRRQNTPNQSYERIRPSNGMLQSRDPNTHTTHSAQGLNPNVQQIQPISTLWSWRNDTENMIGDDREQRDHPSLLEAWADRPVQDRMRPIFTLRNLADPGNDRMDGNNIGNLEGQQIATNDGRSNYNANRHTFQLVPVNRVADTDTSSLITVIVNGVVRELRTT